MNKLSKQNQYPNLLNNIGQIMEESQRRAYDAISNIFSRRVWKIDLEPLCFVLIDLKIGKVNHLDIGQVNMYLNYFKAEENSKSDNPPIGIILAANKDNVLVKYALGGISNKLFVSKYELYLPRKEELQERLKKLLEEN